MYDWMLAQHKNYLQSRSAMCRVETLKHCTVCFFLHQSMVQGFLVPREQALHVLRQCLQLDGLVCVCARSARACTCSRVRAYTRSQQQGRLRILRVLSDKLTSSCIIHLCMPVQLLCICLCRSV